jgi:hypothetical protein
LDGAASLLLPIAPRSQPERRIAVFELRDLPPKTIQFEQYFSVEVRRQGEASLEKNCLARRFVFPAA